MAAAVVSDEPAAVVLFPVSQKIHQCFLGSACSAAHRRSALGEEVLQQANIHFLLLGHPIEKFVGVPEFLIGVHGQWESQCHQVRQMQFEFMGLLSHGLRDPRGCDHPSRHTR